jgi:hypothetical protein
MPKKTRYLVSHPSPRDLVPNILKKYMYMYVILKVSTYTHNGINEGVKNIMSAERERVVPWRICVHMQLSYPMNVYAMHMYTTHTENESTSSFGK